MSYEGARARSKDDENGRAFAISKIRPDRAGGVGDVLWPGIKSNANLDIGAPVVVPLADVIDAIHDGAKVSAVFPERFRAMADYRFQVIEFNNGCETIDLVGPHGSYSQGRLHDLDRLGGRATTEMIETPATTTRAGDVVEQAGFAPVFL